MNLKNLALVTLGCVLSAGCGSRSGGSGGVVTVDFHDYEERPLAEMPEAFYSGKRYVALHADDPEMMIGEIGKVVLHGDRIYVNERGYGPRGRHVLVAHDAVGRAIAKIGNQGRGPGEYLQISDFDVDASERIHLYDGTVGAKKIYIYAPDGKFVGEKQLPFSADMIKCTPDGGYLMVISTWEETEGLAGRRFVKTDADLNVLNVAGEWNMEQVDNNVTLGSGSLVAAPEGIFYQKSPDERLYQLDEEGNITATWFLDLGPHAIPPEDRSNLEGVFEKLNTFRYFGGLVAPTGRYIFGSFRDRGVMKTFVYDLETGVNYTQTPDKMAPFEGFVTISDGRLVGIFPYFDGETVPSDLPAEQRAGVVGGDPLLVLYSLK